MFIYTCALVSRSATSPHTGMALLIFLNNENTNMFLNGKYNVQTGKLCKSGFWHAASILSICRSGLSYGNDDELQRRLVFSSSKANCLNLPFILHSRKATEGRKKKYPCKRTSKFLLKLKEKTASAHTRKGIFCWERCRMQRAGGK